MTPVPVDSPTVTLEVPREVRSRTPVPMTLRVTNPTDRPLTLYLRGRPVAFDLVVSRADGTPVWRRLEGAVITMVLQVRTLAPGDTLELRDSWAQTTKAGVLVPPGDYLVTGRLLTDSPQPLETPAAPLRILPPARR
jgi:hypothetical protein